MNSAGEESIEDADVFAGGDSGTAVLDRNAMKDVPLAFDTPVDNAENGTIGGKLNRVVQHVEEGDVHEVAVGYQQFVDAILVLLGVIERIRVIAFSISQQLYATKHPFRLQPTLRPRNY
jgi:hypothetical protein